MPTLVEGCDVLVVGAGPAGSATAALFAGAGHHVRLLDRSSFPRFKACGDFLSPECTRILRRLGVEEGVRRAGARRLRGLLVSAYGEPALRADFAPGGSGFGYALERSRLDAILLGAARAAGAEVLEEHVVEGLAATGAVRVRTPDRRTLTMRAGLVVGAAGTRCPVARDLGVRRRPAGEGRLDLLAHWDAPADGRPYCEMHVGGPGYTGLAPVGPGLLNVNSVVPRRWLRSRKRVASGAGGARLREDLYLNLLASSPAVRRALGGATLRYPPVASDVSPLRTVRATGPAVLLVGDAALFIDPFTGQGIYMALRSAELAFEVGAAALREGDTGERRLAAYDRLRRAEFAPKVRLSAMLQAILRRPRLARRVAASLRRDPRGAARLIGVIGDYRPAADLLRLEFLVRMASAAPG